MFIGREEYLEDLETLWRKRTCSIVSCRGRRRIGKSTLIREFARRTADGYIEIEGLPPNSKEEAAKLDDARLNQIQLDNFIDVLATTTGCSRARVTTWYEAFARLDGQIDDAKRTVILLDEISWMGMHDANFPGRLRTAWETLFHRHEKLILVICGSVSVWIKENILDNTGFTGRFSRDYVLPELPLSVCTQFWGEARNRVAAREILDVLSVTGGVPRYLEEIDPGLSADENIRRMCFLKSGELFKDFDAIFNPLFGEATETKRKLLIALADGPKSGTELATAIDVGRNGRLSRILRELAEGGFISSDVGKNPETGAECRVGKYRLRDNYTRFYLKYIAEHKGEIERGVFRYMSLEHLPGWNTIMGLQFENLVVNNAMELVPFLGLGNSVVLSAAPYRHERLSRDGEKHGCQIDLLVQTARTAYVVEVKRKKSIGVEIEDEVESKIKRLPLRKGVSARPVLVYDGELDGAVEGNGYFDAIVPARKLLGL